MVLYVHLLSIILVFHLRVFYMHFFISDCYYCTEVKWLLKSDYL